MIYILRFISSFFIHFHTWAMLLLLESLTRTLLFNSLHPSYDKCQEIQNVLWIRIYQKLNLQPMYTQFYLFFFESSSISFFSWSDRDSVIKTQGIRIIQCAICSTDDEVGVAGNSKNAYSTAASKNRRMGIGYGVSLHNRYGRDEKYQA